MSSTPSPRAAQWPPSSDYYVVIPFVIVGAMTVESYLEDVYPMIWHILAVMSWELFILTAHLTHYRLYRHPLARFPGPKSIAATRWVEFYHDVIRGGRFMWEIEKIHQKYGPIVRVSPDEIHIMDSEFFDAVYQRKKLDKDSTWCNLAAARSSVLTTVPHDLHRIRRSVLNPFFSKQSILKLESVIQEKVNKLWSRLKKIEGRGERFRFDVAYMALTSDIISEYAFATCYNYLDDEDFNLEWKETMHKAVATGALFRQFPFLAKIPKALPGWLMDLSPLKQIAQLKRDMREQIQAILAMPEEERDGRTIFHAALDGDLPAEEKTLDRLTDEGQILYGAGSETTAKALTTISFHLLRNPDILAKLKGELAVASLSIFDMKLTRLEKLPYLTAVISEGIRLAGGLTTRAPRVSNSEPLIYKNYIIPCGTPVSQTAYFVLMDPSIFPSPTVFQPERWLEPTETYNKTQYRPSKFMVAFGRGSRHCLGMNLAYAEIYLTVAALFGELKFELCDGVGEDDVKVAKDAFVGATEKGIGKVWAHVKA